MNTQTENETVAVATVLNDRAVLSKLNAGFIQNFIKQDTAAHDLIIHKDFVCIQVSGDIVHRNNYAYENAGYTSFSITDEAIRIFGNFGLIRSKTVYSKKQTAK